jgi:probable F420-dependent oxidoreductase
MSRFKVGLQLHPQGTTTDALQIAWQAADELGADSVWVWDHFFPLYGDPDERHFEAWSLLAAMAVTTKRTRFGAMVSCTAYRNPDLVADMARTIDHLSRGRFILGLGAGWFERDFDEYGYPFGTAGERVDAFADAVARVKDRLRQLNPPAVGPLPLLIGGSGERRTLPVVAEHAQMWNTTAADPELIRHKNRVLDDLCTRIGRDPAEIERTALVAADADVEALLAAGITHLVLMAAHPFDLAPLQRLLDLARD